MIVSPTKISFKNKKLSVIIAGVPGIGKTTLALSAPKPLLIDLDEGVSRVEARHRTDTAIVKNYNELVEDLSNADLSKYETIVIDTGGKLLEMLKPIVISEDHKNGKKDGNLSLQGYGAVKKKFRTFIDFVKSLGKHLVLVFHATEVDVGNDTTGLRIRIEGSSKDEIWDDIDIGGFIEMNNQKRQIGFSNCDRYYAKGTHGVHGLFQIPKLEKTSKNDFLTQLFKKVQDDLDDEVKEYERYQNVMDEIMPKISQCENAIQINEVFDVIKNANHVLTSKEELWFALSERAKIIGAKFVKESGKFE